MQFNEESYLQKQLERLQEMELQVEITAHVTRRDATYTVMVSDLGERVQVKKAKKFSDFVQLHKMVRTQAS